MQRTFLGIGLGILSMFFFSLLYAFFKACTPYIDNTQIIFIQSFLSWIVLIPLVFRKGTTLKTDLFWRIALRTIFGLLGMVCITLALKTTGLAEVVLLNNTAPLFVPLFVWIWMREKISFFLGVSILIGFAGVFVILRPGFETIQTGMLFASLSGVFSALLFIVTKQISGEPFLRILFYYYLIWWILTGPFAIGAWKETDLVVWAFLIGAACVSVAAQITITAALRYASSQEVAPFMYTSVIFSALLGWIFWKEGISFVSLIGMILVILGGILTLLSSRKKRA